MPTEKQSVTDMRPQISFKVVSDELRGARVLIDGLDTGTVGDYLEGVAALRVLSGVHVIKIHQAGRTVVEEKIYIGDGVSRSMLIE
jgi:hypothetical protein